MLGRRILSIVAAASGVGLVAGQSVSNDIPENQILEIVYGDGAERRIHAPNAQMHPGYMENPPQLMTPTWPPSTPSAMIIMLDLDAPFSDSRASRLHWLATGLTPSSTTPSVSALANLTIPNAQVSYEAPDPPIGDVAHTYAFYLIGVPASFTPPQDLAQNRVPFDLEKMLRDAGIGEESVIARNHFRIRDLKGTPTQGFPGPRASETGRVVGGSAGASTGVSSAGPGATGVVTVGAQGGSRKVGVGMGMGMVGVLGAAVFL
ncbi:hypothetical protein HBI56_208700 [Parastagonospora nodorum]|nr:hypothetical protein HBH56_220090 [Parastagonospora nodorum]KAH3922011.1 hypothetical protein HBH54_230220 [Parastagonospora nodorum]KAH3941357.1 hypothetical protein HBH53_204090 [Parastagonospora nodorum]KAH3958727.1 hypothetical protein HBH51_207360 [Parastagonospora nodorum]KAH3991565.1 hypothetical protein HBI10_229470 [Parastagonospora nodorum]